MDAQEWVWLMVITVFDKYQNQEKYKLVQIYTFEEQRYSRWFRKNFLFSNNYILLWKPTKQTNNNNNSTSPFLRCVFMCLRFNYTTNLFRL